MKEIEIVEIYIDEKLMTLVAKSLTKGINEKCPNGYHYKETVMLDIKEKCDYGYYGYVLVAFEKD